MRYQCINLEAHFYTTYLSSKIATYDGWFPGVGCALTDDEKVGGMLLSSRDCRFNQLINHKPRVHGSFYLIKGALKGPFGPRVNPNGVVGQ